MGQIDTFKSKVDQSVTNQTGFNSISPLSIGTLLKQLADIVGTFSLTATNGLVSNTVTNTFGLDPTGKLTIPGYIDVNAQGICFYDSTTNSVYAFNPNYVELLTVNRDGLRNAQLAIDNNSFIQLFYNNGTIGQAIGLFISDLGAFFTDNILNKGIVYSGDYEANFVNRSLITLQYLLKFVQPLVGTINDGGGPYTSTQLNTLFPTAQIGQQAQSTTRVYQKGTSSWFYFTKTNC